MQNKGIFVNRRKSHALVCDILSYTILLLIGFCMITQIVAFSYVALILALFVTFKYNESLIPILFFVFLLPTMFDPGLAIGIDKILLAIVFLGNILSPSHVRGIKYGLKCLPFFIWLIIACFLSGYLTTYSDAWAGMGILVSDIIVFLMYVNSALPQSKIPEIVERFAKCAFLMMILLLFKSILNPISVNDRLTLEDDLNINGFAMCVTQTSSVLFTFMLFCKKNAMERFVYLAAFTIGLFLLISTGSRSATIALLGSCSILYLATMKLKKLSLLRILYLLVLFVILTVVFNYVISNNSYIGERYTVESLVESDGASRGISMAIEVEHVIPENIILGVGPSGRSEMDAVSRYGGYYSSHNIIISTLTQIGIFGFIPFVIICFIIIRKLFKMVKISPIYSIPLGLVLACILNGIGEVVYNSRMMWFALSFSLYLINSNSIEGVLSNKKVKF